MREVKNYLERSLTGGADVAREDGATARSDLAALTDARLPYQKARERWTAVIERRYLVELLRVHDGNVTVAARAAGTTRTHLYRLLWKHGLR